MAKPEIDSDLCSFWYKTNVPVTANIYRQDNLTKLLVGVGMLKSLGTLLLRSRSQLSCSVLLRRSYHTTQRCLADFDELRTELDNDGPKKFLEYNDIVYPPTKPGEEIRPAEVCHMRANIMASRKKMWYATVMVRGLSIDEAIKQCSFHKKKCPHIVKEVLLEAQEVAVRDHNVEFKSNLWVADAYCTKGMTLKGQKLHSRGRMGTLHFNFCHLFIRLREGTPPEHYYPPEPSGNQKMEEYIKEQRSRKILESL